MLTIQAKRCKGPGHAHYILPAYKGVHINEILGYCSPCWTRQLIAENYQATNPESIRRTRPYTDSKINNKNFVQCGVDTL